MLSAQDEAFVRLAIDRGILAPAVLAQAAAMPPSFKGVVQSLVEAGLLPPAGAADLYRELVRLVFRCEVCSRQASYEALSSYPRFVCPCGGGLVPAPAPAAPADSGSFPLPAPDGSWNPDRSDFVREAFGSARFRAEIRPGMTIGPYQLERELGRGANGVVFYATRQGLARGYAVKVLLEDEAPDAETIARFELEAAIGSKLRDPGVITVFDVGRAGESLYYAMEYSPGPTLKEVLKERGRLPWREAVDLCRQLALTLDHCHQNSVIHRDLKPGNVILDEELNRPRVTDFGLARDRTLANTMTEAGDWLGTPYYMSPEQFLGELDLDHRADLYALGVILFEALTGERPYVAKSAQELMEVVLAGNPPAPRSFQSGLPKDLDAITLRAMASAREERYASGKELAADLQLVLDGRRLPLPKARLVAAVLVFLSAVFFAGALVYHRAQTARAPGTPLASASPRRSATPTPSPGASAPNRPEGIDWGALVADERLWAGELDPDTLRDKASSKDTGRLEAIGAVRELLATARRGAPWRDLGVIADRARAAKGWLTFQTRMDALEARLLIARGRAQGAETLLGERKGPRVLWIRYLAQTQRGASDEAKETLATLHEQSGPLAALGRARSARLNSEPEAALQHLETVGELLDAKLEQAEALYELGDPSRASAALEAFLQGFGPSPRALLLQGDLNRERGELDSALGAYARGVELSERDPTLVLSRRQAETLIALQRHADALELLDRIAPGKEVERPRGDDVDLLVLRGIAHHALGQEDRAQEDWARANAASPERASAAFPPDTKEEVHMAYAAATVDATEGVRLLQEMMAAARDEKGPWHQIAPLGRLPKQAKERFKEPTSGTQTERDVALALRTAALGKPWDEVLFYLTRALESGKAQELVRSTWLRLAISRGQSLESVEKRLGGDLRVYRLSERQAALYRAEVAWLRGRAGEGYAGFAALAKASPNTQEGQLAAAFKAFLEADHARVRVVGLKLGTTWKDARGVAFAGLAEVALGKVEDAAGSLRLAYALAGASDYRVLALRAALCAGRSQKPTLFAPIGDDVASRYQLQLGGPGADRLALRALAETTNELQQGFLATRLADLKAQDSAELDLIRGRAWVALKKERPRCLAAWQAARKADPQLAVPTPWLAAYANAYGTSEGLDPLR